MYCRIKWTEGHGTEPAAKELDLKDGINSLAQETCSSAAGPYLFTCLASAHQVLTYQGAAVAAIHRGV